MQCVVYCFLIFPLAFFFHCWRPSSPESWVPNALMLLSGCRKLYSTDPIISEIPSVLKLCCFRPSSLFSNPLFYPCPLLRNDGRNCVILKCTSRGDCINTKHLQISSELFCSRIVWKQCDEPREELFWKAEVVPAPLKTSHEAITHTLKSDSV